jgi:3D (Asp-Asp-Asp) domain-containing protein
VTSQFQTALHILGSFILARSLRNKVAATFLAVSVFVFLYGITSDDAVWLWRTEQVYDPSRPQPGARLLFSATAYCKGNTTASGVQVRTGVAAADPAILPVGSVVTVTTDSSRYNGVYTVMDTGPEVKGRELDLYLWSCNEALEFGRKQVQVNVLRLGWNPSASTPSLIDRLFRRQPGRPQAVPEATGVTPPAAVAPDAPTPGPDAAADSEPLALPVTPAGGDAPDVVSK